MVKKRFSTQNNNTKKRKRWFFREDPVESYYTIWPKMKSNIIVPGPGDRFPTPQEVYECFMKNEDCSYDRSGLLFGGKSIIGEDPIQLPAGCYFHRSQSFGSYIPERLISTDLRNDTFVEMTGITKNMVNDIRTFLANENVYREIGIQYRRGFLLYGLPGEGKTTIIREVIKREIPKNSITIFIEQLPSRAIITNLKNDNRLKIIVLEELVTFCDSNQGSAARLLDFLDGETSLDNAIVFATTNYPERLPGNIVDRPSRFDRLIKVGSPNTTTRKGLLSLYLGRSPTADEIENTKDLSVATIKEVSLLSRLHKVSLKKTIDYISKIQNLVKKEFDESVQISFLRSNDSDNDEAPF